MAKPEDGTAEWEDAFKGAAQDFADGLKYLFATEAPRPLGSEKVSLEEQKLTYSLMKDDPAQLHAFFQEQGASVESAVAHMRHMRKLLNLDS